MKKVVVVGNGFVASHLPYEKSSIKFDPRWDQISDFLWREKPDVVVNCIGFCGAPNIDACQIEKTRTYTANVTMPLLFAQACKNRNIRFIHVGSGCINYGKSPNNKCTIIEEKFHCDNCELCKSDSGWRETDYSSPQSYYSKTKYAADLVLGELENTTILRIRMPISGMKSPRNLLTKLIGYKRVVEAPNSVTFMDDFVNAIDFVIQKEKIGIYNVVSPIPLTHSILLNEYKLHVPSHTYESIGTEELSSLVAAPRSNCILDSSKIVNEGFVFTDTYTQMRATIKKFVENQ